VAASLAAEAKEPRGVPGRCNLIGDFGGPKSANAVKPLGAYRHHGLYPPLAQPRPAREARAG
jgi:hypothetical protein